MIAKVGLGVIGLGAISIGGVAFTKPEWLGINREISWTPLAEDSNFKGSSTSSGYEGKFGSKYKYYLVGSVGSDKNRNENEAFWNESYARLVKAEIEQGSFSVKGGSKKVGSAYSTSAPSADSNNQKALNQICDDAYKADSASVKASGNNANEFNEEHVWKYCSPLGEKLKTISDSGSNTYTTDGTIGHDATNKTKLASATGNDKFWELRDKEFRGVGKYQKIEEAKDNFFNPDKGKTIKDLCKEAYQKAAVTSGDSTAEAPTSAKALKYCSINKE